MIPTSPPWRPGHSTLRACKPVPGLGLPPRPPAGSGQLLTPLATKGLWTRATAPTSTAQDLGNRDRELTKAPQAPAPDQGWPREGKEPGEIPEMPLSPAKIPGPVPGACKLSSLTSTPARLRARHPVPSQQPTRRHENAKLYSLKKKKTQNTSVSKIKLKQEPQSPKPSVSQ